MVFTADVIVISPAELILVVPELAIERLLSLSIVITAPFACVTVIFSSPSLFSNSILCPAWEL